MHNLNELKRGIVRKGFPELWRIHIAANYQRFKYAYFDFDRIRDGVYIIGVDKELSRCPIPVIEGGMAHELAHIEIDVRMNPFMRTIDRILYSASSRYETWDERRTDKLVVERGYGEQLLEFLKYANNEREAFTSRDGLSIDELEQMIRKSTPLS